MNWYAFSFPSLLELGAQVAVVLLVRAVELEDRSPRPRVKCDGPLSSSSATNVLRYSLAILIASTLLGFGLFAQPSGPSSSSLVRPARR